jgi:hypothetical protein
MPPVEVLSSAEAKGRFMGLLLRPMMAARIHLGLSHDWLTKVYWFSLTLSFNELELAS